MRAVDLALLLCRTLFGVQVSRQSAAAATVLAEQVAVELDEPAAPPKSDWQRLNYQLQLQDRQADRLRMAWNWLFGLNFQDVPRSDASGLAAYAHRPVRLLRKRGVGGAASILKQTARGLWS